MMAGNLPSLSQKAAGSRRLLWASSRSHCSCLFPETGAALFWEIDYEGDMDVEQLKEDVLGGLIPVDRLIDVLVTSQRELQAAKQELDEAKRRIADLERQLGNVPTQKVSQSFSLRAEEQRQEARGKKRGKRNRWSRGGRTTTMEKVAQAARTEKVYPSGVPKEDCWLSHTRPVWRLENGQAVLVAYEIYRGPKNQYGKIPGVFGRSEFGAEIVLALAYQVYVVGLSFDKACLLMNFFQHLTLRKSQADALLNQLRMRRRCGRFSIRRRSRGWWSATTRRCMRTSHSRRNVGRICCER